MNLSRTHNFRKKSEKELLEFFLLYLDPYIFKEKQNGIIKIYYIFIFILFCSQIIKNSGARKGGVNFNSFNNLFPILPLLIEEDNVEYYDNIGEYDSVFGLS